MQRTVSALAAEGVIELQPNPDDRRAPLVILIPKGRALHQALSQRQARWASACLNRIEAETLAVLAAQLRDMTERVRHASALLRPHRAPIALPTAPGRRLVQVTAGEQREEPF